MPDLPTTRPRADRIMTVPNLLSVLRLAGVPLFLYLLLVPRADGWAILVLAVGGFTDWLDGKLARLLGQYSRLGALLDPAVDRLYILAALIALGARDVVPWWGVVALVCRDLVLAATLGCALAGHARSELYATGARPRHSALSGVESLTASERRVAVLAAAGQTNRDIAQALFVTPKTVEVHLSNTYRKLGIRSRRELAGALASE